MQRVFVIGSLVALLGAAAACSAEGRSGSAVDPGNIWAVSDRGAGGPPARPAGRTDAARGDRGHSPVDDGADGGDTAFFGPLFGRPCEGHEDCGQGWCVDGPDGHVCTSECVDNCPEGWSCRGESLFGGADQISVCVPKVAKVCEPCSRRSDCGGIPECALPAGATSSEEGGICLHGCEALGAPCPGGFVCSLLPLLPALEPVWVCAPEEAAGCCAAAIEGTEAVCTRHNEHGACLGARVCRGVDGWGPCTARLPAAEVCDRMDNDCDGESDEGLGALCSCGDGACTGPAAGEDALTCPVDCAGPGDGVCSPGESPAQVPEDCCGGGCGDGRCLGYGCGEGPASCPEDCGTACGNGTCDKGESPRSCKADCQRQLCGNGACEPTDGGPQECPGDCGPACGNCICEGSEDFLRCPIDCGYCGDGVCSMCGHLDEPLRCPEDCAAAQEICNGADDDGDGETDEGTCDDGDVCTRDLCEAESGRCTYPQADDGAPCDDDDACTEGDACEGGACAGTSKIDCDDGNDCTDDGCSPTAGCTHAPNDAQCNDDDRCTAGDACQAGICVGGPAFDCDDEDPCTDDACDPATGCTHSDPYPECAFPCKGGEPCELRNDLGVCAGVTECVGGEPVCNAREPSAETCNGRDDDCDAATDEDVPAEPCVVENQFGSCAGMTDCVLGGTVCPAPEPETEACDGRDNDCDGETDEGYLDTDRDGRADCADLDDDEDQVPDGGDNCPLEPNPGQEDFDDDDFGDVCDLDDDDDGSLDEEDCAPLDPGNAPGLIEVCDQRDNNCDGRADEGLCDDGNPCTDDGCDADGSCGYEFNTLPCEDGSLCTEDDRCENGRCQGGDDLDCDDGNPCTDDTCDPSSGCSHKHNTKSCDDGDPCTEPDACSGGECAGGPPKDCSDGDACNGLETCHPGTGGGCRPGTPPSCDAYPNSRCDTDLGCVCDPVDCAWLEVECGSAPDRCGALLECGDCPTEDLTCAAGRCLEVDGSPCESRAECASGLCVDGFCCATACTGRCRRCDIAGTFGQCDDTPAGIDPDDDCEGASVCDGARGCMCVPDCGSRECGDNGCGGSCGDCEETRICEDGTCRCRPKAQVLCDGDMLYWYDGCGGRGDKIADCPHGCDGSSCQGCPPACVGKECGPDGCGGTCGTCTKGVCLSQGVCGCRDGWECGPAEICHEAACGPAYGRAYRITIYEAEISDKKPGTDEDWDPFWDGYNPWGGLPDPKLRFKHGTFETTTSTASNTNRPRWNEHVDMLLEESDVLVFDVWDDDDVDEHIGGFSSTVRIRWLKNEAVELIPTDPDYGLQSLTLFFEAAPASCPSGNGKYCGESIGKTTGTLYNCSNGSWSVQQVCPGTCHVAAPGYADYCD